MKKLTVMLLTVILVLGAFAGAFSASAVTKEDIISKISTTAIYKYISGDIANLARTVDATPEQLEKLSDIADRFVALKLSDKGPSADTYTAAEIQATLKLIDEACALFGYTYTFTPDKNAVHKGDVTFILYDENGKQIYSYEGDAVRKTGSDQTGVIALISVLGCGLLVGAAFAAKAAKRRTAI